MWATLALTTALSLTPAQAGGLELKNPRPTFGILGQPRPDYKFLQGDVFVLSYDIDNLTVKEDGLVTYSMGMEVTDKDGKAVFKKEPKQLQATNALGGSRVPAFALVQIGGDTPVGKYTVKVTVTDVGNNKTATLEKGFEVLPPEFGFINLDLRYDGGLPAPPLGVPGQRFLLNFGVVGFGADPKSKQPNVLVELSILDAATGKPTLKKPFSGEAKDVEAKVKVIPWQFAIDPDRAGKFKLEITATDRVTKKTIKQTLDFTIMDLATK
jgi:hypothetical protein